MEVFSNSEIGQLKRVIMHRPDSGIARISPKRAEELLFDDIVHLPKMQEEHDCFTELMSYFVGEGNIMETQVLLKEALGVSKENTTKFLKLILDYEELPASFMSHFEGLTDNEIAEVLICGYASKTDYILFDPIPNFIFTRDIAVTINDHMIITKATKSARHRENWLTRFILKNHPSFSKHYDEGRILNLNNVEMFPPSAQGEPVCIEGGDVMIINKDYLLVGISERTTEHAIDSVAKVLFDKKVIKYVVKIAIPAQRSCMHIDTIFTQIDTEDIVCYKPIVFDGLSSHVRVCSADEPERFYHSVKDFFHAEINSNMRFIFAGNAQSPYQEREQWTDGCNMVAVKPGVAFSYDRNPFTDQALEAAGYSVVQGETLLEKLKSGTLKVDQINHTIINLTSNELSRARGGSHCMTCPIERESI